jgi:peptide/nickel transport system permease protein
VKRRRCGRLQRPSRETSLALLVAAALLAAIAVFPLLAPHDPAAQDVGSRLSGPSAEHPLGSDHLGRDVLSRLLEGARFSLGLAVAAVTVSGVAGTTLGMFAGRFGGWLSSAVNRTVDALIALPAILVGLLLAAALRPGLGTLFLAVVLTGWTPFARLGYALTLKIGAREYVTAAVALGANERQILLRHILPAASGPVLALGCLQFAAVLLSIAGLSFLGLGAQPPTPEWGAMLSEAQPYLARRPDLVLLPAGAVVLSTLSVAALGRLLEKRWAVRVAQKPRSVPGGRAA